MRNEKGFTLVEMLIAVSLYALAMVCLTNAWLSCAHAHERARAELVKYEKVRSFFLRLERDLRRAVNDTEHPFRGKEDELSFETYVSPSSRTLSKSFTETGYLFSERGLSRSEKDPETEEILRERSFPGFEAIRFSFPYRKEGGEIFFLPFWLEEPYQGLPSEVRVELSLSEGMKFTRSISLPQGRAGVLPNEV